MITKALQLFKIFDTRRQRYKRVFRTPDGRVVHTVFFNSLFKDLMGIGGRIIEYQIVQVSGSDFVLKMVKGEQFEQRHIRFLQSKIREHLGEAVNFRLTFVARIERPIHGKYITFTRDFRDERTDFGPKN